MRTCTSDSIDSQMRGGENMTFGPISRRSVFCVALSSGKDSVSPRLIPQATASICSPIHAKGRKDT